MSSSPAPPPSERAKGRRRRDETEERRGVGLFRLFGFGWAITLALVILVAVVLVIGTLRNDPFRNPPPTGYVTATCDAFDELAAGTDAIERAVIALRADDLVTVEEERLAAETHVLAANAALRDLPAWPPGERLDELLAALIVVILQELDQLAGADLADVDRAAIADEAAGRLEVARTLVDDGRTAFTERRYAFDCAGG